LEAQLESSETSVALKTITRHSLDGENWSGKSFKNQVVTQLGTGWSKRLPAQKTGGRYKTCYQQRMVVL
jgi:hypothetical protein